MRSNRTHAIAITIYRIALAATVVGACAGAPAQSGLPSQAAPTPAVPGASGTATPPIAPSARPTSLPTPTVDAWVPAGSTSGDHGSDSARLFALPDGAALLLDRAYDPDRLITERWDPDTGWSEGGTIGRRVQFGAVLLRDGRVLVAGGMDAAQSLATASTYDPAAGTWTPASPMAQARTDPAMALLPDGRVLVAGGYFYDPEPYPESGTLPRADLAGFIRPPGDGSVAGGGGLPDVVFPPRGPALATAEVFDPATGTWSATGPMRYARTNPSIVTLTDGRVLVVGAADDGASIDGRAFTTAEVYEPTTGRFSSVAALPGIDRSEISGRGVQVPDGEPLPGMTGSLAALPDGGAVLVGNEVHWKHEGQVVRTLRIDAALATWDEILPAFAWSVRHGDTSDTEQRTGPTSLLNAMAFSLTNGAVLVAGGFRGGEWSSGPLPVGVARYLPSERTWSALPDLPEARSGWLGCRLADGSVLVVGGTFLTESSGEPRRTAWRLAVPD